MSIRVRKEVSVKIIFENVAEKEDTIRFRCPRMVNRNAKEQCGNCSVSLFDRCLRCWEKSGIELEVKG